MKLAFFILQNQFDSIYCTIKYNRRMNVEQIIRREFFMIPRTKGATSMRFKE